MQPHMESRPPLDSPNPEPPPADGPRPPSGPQPRKPNGPTGASAHPALWLVLIAILFLIIWLNTSGREVQVNYSPWFLDQVQNDNIESITIEGLTARGKLRRETEYLASPKDTKPQSVREFLTYFPSEQSVDPIVQKLRELEPKPPYAKPVIETS